MPYISDIPPVVVVATPPKPRFPTWEKVTLALGGLALLVPALRRKRRAAALRRNPRGRRRHARRSRGRR